MRRSISTASFGRKAFLDFWDRAEQEVERDDDQDLEALDQHFPDEEPGVRGFRRKPVYLDERDEWN